MSSGIATIGGIGVIVMISTTGASMIFIGGKMDIAAMRTTGGGIQTGAIAETTTCGNIAIGITAGLQRAAGLGGVGKVVRGTATTGITGTAGTKSSMAPADIMISQGATGTEIMATVATITRCLLSKGRPRRDTDFVEASLAPATRGVWAPMGGDAFSWVLPLPKP